MNSLENFAKFVLNTFINTGWVTKGSIRSQRITLKRHFYFNIKDCFVFHNKFLLSQRNQMQEKFKYFKTKPEFDSIN